jgi:hypothetical protein
MHNQDILQQILLLVEEEHRLRTESAHPHNEHNDAGTGAQERRTRLRRIEQDLDQCWDLLRQRRAKQVAGEDPGSAMPRPANEVENYRQ